MIQPIWPPIVQPPSELRESDMPHVLLVVDQFAKTLGGGERVVMRMAHLLPQYGFKVSILTFSLDPESPVLSEAQKCPLYLLPLKRTYDLQAIRSAFALQAFLDEHNIRIVQTFFESSDLWAGLIVKVLGNAKLIWSRRDMGILRSAIHHVAYRLFSSLPDRVFAVSEQVRKHCMEVDGIDSGRVETIHNGIDLASPPAARTITNAPLVITTVGNIRRVKGHDVFIRAAAFVLKQYPDTRFSIAGSVLDTDYFSELKRLTEELNISDNFHFTGPTDRVAEHLRQADIFILPSRSEGFSNAIVEAMAESLPVVATDVGGNAEAVLSGVTGFIFPANNVDELTRAILALCNDRQAILRMGTAGRARAEELFSEAAIMHRIETAYRHLLYNEG
jgi:glycosyltransferase involved in cell wall biosynthesis